MGLKRRKKKSFIIIIHPEFTFKSDAVTDVLEDRRPLLDLLCFRFPYNAALAQSGSIKKPVIARTDIDMTCCTNHPFMQSYLNYLSVWPHSHEQMQSVTSSVSVLLLELFSRYPCLSPGSLRISLLVLFQQSDTTSLRDINIKSLALYWTNFSTPAHICLLTPWAFDMKHILDHVFC